jgi:dolichyl-phosphate beta-glucosyltransferase
MWNRERPLSVTSASQENSEGPVDHPVDDGADSSCSGVATTLTVSVVVPAYNEEKRLPPYLESIRQHFDSDLAGCYEVIVVDDGSTDGMADLLERRAEGFPQLRIVGHSENCGKGAAVRTGVLAARGRYVLFADADGATPIEEERRLRAQLQSDVDIAIGSRRVASTEVARNRNPFRGVVGKSFAGLARLLLGLSVRDTQCGFKMFRHEVAVKLFPQMREEGYYFDLEMLILADRYGYRVVEVPINWADQPGSRMSFAREIPSMIGAFRRLRRLRRSKPE